MMEKQEQVKIVVAYPPLKGFILKAYNLQHLLATSFSAAVELEERIGEQLSMSLNGAAIYSHPVDKNLQIDTEGIIKAICACNIALKKAPKIEVEDEPDDDPEHRQWLNSVCSGE